MLRSIAVHLAWFVAGAVVAATAFLLRGHLLHLSETANDMPTMGLASSRSSALWPHRWAELFSF